VPRESTKLSVSIRKLSSGTVWKHEFRFYHGAGWLTRRCTCREVPGAHGTFGAYPV